MEFAESVSLRFTATLRKNEKDEEGDKKKEALKLPFISISNALLWNSGLL